MLKIDFMGKIIKDIGYPDDYFAATYDDAWSDDPFIKQMIKDIDKSEVFGANNIISSVLGPINCMQLSTGVKNLIIAYKTSEIIDASFCGNNCGDWLLKIAEMKDLSITMYHLFEFSDKFAGAYIYNTDEYIHTLREYVLCAGKELN